MVSDRATGELPIESAFLFGRLPSDPVAPLSAFPSKDSIKEISDMRMKIFKGIRLAAGAIRKFFAVRVPMDRVNGLRTR